MFRTFAERVITEHLTSIYNQGSLDRENLFGFESLVFLVSNTGKLSFFNFSTDFFSVKLIFTTSLPDNPHPFQNHTNHLRLTDKVANNLS